MLQNYRVGILALYSNSTEFKVQFYADFEHYRLQKGAQEV